MFWLLLLVFGLMSGCCKLFCVAAHSLFRKHNGAFFIGLRLLLQKFPAQQRKILNSDSIPWDQSQIHGDRAVNPIKGTPFADKPSLEPLEILKSVACFRFILPKQEIMIAGGRTVNLRDLQSMIFMAGASALMVGNYLTTLNQPVEKDLQMLRDLGLDPSWDKHGFSDQEEASCGCSEEVSACK
jgi:hypothetical protein